MLRRICRAPRSGCAPSESAASASSARRRREPAPGSRLRLGGAARRRVAIGIEQAAHEQRAADAVDGGVMDLRDEREAPALEPLDHVHLPERPVAAQRHLGDPRDRARTARGSPPGAGSATRCRWASRSNVGIVDPDRMARARAEPRRACAAGSAARAAGARSARACAGNPRAARARAIRARARPSRAAAHPRSLRRETPRPFRDSRRQVTNPPRLGATARAYQTAARVASVHDDAMKT